MSKIDYTDALEELVIFLRNNMTDPSSRGANATDTFNGTGTTYSFNLTKQGVKNVSAVTVDSVAKSFGTDYTVSYGNTTTTVTFVSAPGVGTNNVSITYHYGETWIYGDMPRADLTLKSFPRMSVSYVSVATRPAGLNMDGWFSSLLFQISAYSTSDTLVRNLLDDAKGKFMDNKKSFYYLKQVTPVGWSPAMAYSVRASPEGGRLEIVQQSMDIEAPLVFES